MAFGQKLNGCSENGGYGSDEDSERAENKGKEESNMEVEEAASSSSSTPLSSPFIPKARRGRKSKSNSENRSKICIIYLTDICLGGRGG